MVSGGGIPGWGRENEQSGVGGVEASGGVWEGVEGWRGVAGGGGAAPSPKAQTLDSKGWREREICMYFSYCCYFFTPANLISSSSYVDFHGKYSS